MAIEKEPYSDKPQPGKRTRLIAGIVSGCLGAYIVVTTGIFPSYVPWLLIAGLIVTSLAVVLLSRIALKQKSILKKAPFLVFLVPLFYLWVGLLLGVTGLDAWWSRAPDENVIRWRNNSINRISNLDQYDPSEYKFLKPLLANRRIVLLGESNHYVNEYSQFKAHLIRYLHEEMGFKVLAFESNMFSCFKIDRDLTSDTRADDAMTCVYRIWQTDVVRELFRYIIYTRSTDSPLEIAGFDTYQGSYKWLECMSYLHELIMKSDVNRTHELQMESKRFSAISVDDLIKGKIKQEDAISHELSDHFTELANELERLHSSGTNANSPDSNELLVAAQLARNLVYEPFYNSLWINEKRALRDSIMASNVIYLAEQVYPNEKIIIWAHNGHISKAYSKARMADQTALLTGWILNIAQRVRRMGEHLNDRYGDNMYVLGLYMASGSYGVQNGGARKVRPLRRDSVEYLLRDLEADAVCLDLTQTYDPAGATWQNKPSKILYSGQCWFSIIPSEHYDGIFVVSTASAANQ